jgi:hypothetical protein
MNSKELEEQAFDLAFFILEDEVAARIVAREALKGLPQAIKRQEKMLKHDALKARRRMVLSPAQLLQRLVYEMTTAGEIQHGKFSLYYLKHIISYCLGTNSFASCIAVGVFIYDLQLQMSLQMYDILAADPDPQEDAHMSRKKHQIFDSLMERFDGLLEEDRRDPRELRFFYQVRTDRAILESYLVRLAPWEANCKLPDRVEIGQPLVGLHPEVVPEGERKGRKKSDLEINRVWILVDPASFRLLCKAIKSDGVEPAFRIPRFRPPRT